MFYYKVKQGSFTHENLSFLLSRIRECNNAALELMREVGAIGIYRGSFAKAGGCFAFEFENEPDEKIYKKRAKGWFPRTKNKENKLLFDKINALPTVSIFEWISAFNIEGLSQPGCIERNGKIYVESYSKLGIDFEEIKMSEWALAKESKASSTPP